MSRLVSELLVSPILLEARKLAHQLVQNNAKKVNKRPPFLRK
jgi:hypothetical protein